MVRAGGCWHLPVGCNAVTTKLLHAGRPAPRKSSSQRIQDWEAVSRARAATLSIDNRTPKCVGSRWIKERGTSVLKKLKTKWKKKKTRWLPLLINSILNPAVLRENKRDCNEGECQVVVRRSTTPRWFETEKDWSIVSCFEIISNGMLVYVSWGQDPPP